MAFDLSTATPVDSTSAEGSSLLPKPTDFPDVTKRAKQNKETDVQRLEQLTSPDLTEAAALVPGVTSDLGSQAVNLGQGAFNYVKEHPLASAAAGGAAVLLNQKIYKTLKDKVFGESKPTTATNATPELFSRIDPELDISKKPIAGEPIFDVPNYAQAPAPVEAQTKPTVEQLKQKLSVASEVAPTIQPSVQTPVASPQAPVAPPVAPIDPKVAKRNAAIAEANARLEAVKNSPDVVNSEYSKFGETPEQEQIRKAEAQAKLKAATNAHIDEINKINSSSLTSESVVAPESPKELPNGPQTKPVVPPEAPKEPVLSERVQKAAAAVPPEVQAKYASEGKVVLKGYGAGDVSIANTYGKEAYAAIVDQFNNGQPIGSDENYKKVQAKINKGVPSNMAPFFASKLPASEADAGTFGPKELGERIAYTPEGKIVTSPSTINKYAREGKSIGMVVPKENLQYGKVTPAHLGGIVGLVSAGLLGKAGYDAYSHAKETGDWGPLAKIAAPFGVGLVSGPAGAVTDVAVNPESYMSSFKKASPILGTMTELMASKIKNNMSKNGIAPPTR